MPPAAVNPASATASTTPPPPTRVLLTNDDGPASPFFIAFAAALGARTGWATFSAPPADGQSFVSKALSTGGKGGGNHVSGGGGGGGGRGAGAAIPHHAVAVTHVAPGTAHVAGPPATAVNLALYHLAPDCDFVVSGPNIGHNAGRGSLLSSGTVGAAMEAAVAGRRAVSLSFPFFNGWGAWTDAELEAAVSASVDLVARLWATWAPGVDVYNVNVPLDHRGGVGGRGVQGAGGGVGEAEEEGAGRDGGKEAAAAPAAAPSPPPPRRVLLTTVDPGAQYASLYTPAVAGGDGERAAAGGGAATTTTATTTPTPPPAATSSFFAWGPSGLRVFEAPDPAPGGDVAAIAAGHISVSPLVAGFGGVVHEGWEE
jgi:5'/3'-nucleotidase SurE